MHNFALGLGESHPLRLLLVALILLVLLPFTIALVIVLVIMMGQAAQRSKWSLEEWGYGNVNLDIDLPGISTRSPV